MSTELVIVPKPSTELVWVETRRERRERERADKRRFIRWLALCATAAFGTVFVTATIVNQPPQQAAATETTEPAPPPPPPPTPPKPEVITTTTGAGWTTVRVDTHEGDFRAKLITDGHRGTERILPGETAVAILTLDADLSKAATVNIEDRPWRIYERGTVPANNISPLTYRTDRPVIAIISEVPGDMRAYIKAVPK